MRGAVRRGSASSVCSCRRFWCGAGVRHDVATAERRRRDLAASSGLLVDAPGSGPGSPRGRREPRGGAPPAGLATLTRGLFFFFQAEDGIRDLTVTGVQTCALPI